MQLTREEDEERTCDGNQIQVWAPGRPASLRTIMSVCSASTSTSCRYCTDLEGRQGQLAAIGA